MMQSVGHKLKNEALSFSNLGTHKHTMISIKSSFFIERMGSINAEGNGSKEKDITHNLLSFLLSSYVGNGYIEGIELDGFLREFVESVNNTDSGPEVVSDAMMTELRQCFLEAYDDNKDGKIEIREVVFFVFYYSSSFECRLNNNDVAFN